MALSNDLELTENALTEAAYLDPHDIRREKFIEITGINQDSLNMFRVADEMIKSSDTQEQSQGVMAKNILFHKIAEILPVKELQGVSSTERFTLKNLFDTAGTEIQSKYLRDRGYETKIEKDEILVRRPNELQWSKIDPKTIDMFEATKDIGDVAVDLITGALSTAGTLTGSFVGGAAAGNFAELAKQAVRRGMGYEEQDKVAKVAGQTLLGGAGGMIGYGAGKLIGKMVGYGKEIIGQATKGLSGEIATPAIQAEGVIQGEKLLPDIVQPLTDKGVGAQIKSTYPQTLASAQKLGLSEADLLPSQKFMSRELQSQEGYLLKGSDLAGRELRAKSEKIAKTLQDTADSLVSNAGRMAGMDKAEVGQTLKSGVIERAKEILAPAEAIYNEIESQLKFIPIKKEAIENLKKEIEKGMMALSPGDTLKSKMISDLDKIKTIADLKNLRTVVGSGYGTELNYVEKQIADTVYNGLTDIRSATLKELAPKAKSQIDQADALFRQGVEQISESLGIDKFKSGVIASLDKALDKKTAEQAVNELFPLKNQKQLEAFAKNFPNEFNQAKDWYVKTLVDRSEGATGLYKGMFDPFKFARNLQDTINNSPTTLNLLFGKDGAIKAKAMVDVVKSFPPTFNPSETGSFIQQLFNSVTSPAKFAMNIGSFQSTLKLAAFENKKLLEASGAINALNKLDWFGQKGRGILGKQTTTGIIESYREKK